jgi:ketosteroid isomerase-like protein
MVTIKHQFFFLLLLVLPAGMLSAQSKTRQISKTIQILVTEEARIKAMIDKDSVALLQYLSPDLVYIHSNTLVESRQEHIHAITSGKIIYQIMDRSQNNVRFYGKIAINTGNIHVKGIISGNPFDVNMLYTAVYQKKKKRWLLLSWQTTRKP